MKQLRTLIAAAAAALLSATAVQAQTTPSTGFPATDPPASMRDSTGPANSDRNTGSAATTGTQDVAPQATQADTAISSPQEQLRNDRAAARTEMKRAGSEAAAAQRAAMAERGAQGEMSTPQQDRGGLSGLGSESWPENNAGRSQ